MRRRARFASILPCLLLALLLGQSSIRAEFVRGDANVDAAVDIGDPIFALGYLFGGGCLSCLDAADANDDGAVDVGDPISILNYLFLASSPLPPPFPDCGLDPTADVLGCAAPPAACPPLPRSAPLFLGERYAVGGNPNSLKSGDFNGDCALDLATANYGSNDVSVLLGDGTGNFTAAQGFAVGSDPYSVTAADFDGDGALDLATANGGGNDVSVLLGDGTGSFAAAQAFAVGLEPRLVTAADFDGDCCSAPGFLDTLK